MVNGQWCADSWVRSSEVDARNLVSGIKSQDGRPKTEVEERIVSRK